MTRTATFAMLFLVAAACGGGSSTGDDDDTGMGPDASMGSGCVPETLAELCTAKSYACGDVTLTDRCGNSVAGSCGTCSTGTCNTDHSCPAPAAWQQVQWPSLAQMRVFGMWNTPGSARIWASAAYLGSGELWTIDGQQITTYSVSGSVVALHGYGNEVWGAGTAGLVVHGVNGSFTVANNTGLTGYNLHEVFSFAANDVWVTTNGINGAAHWNGTTWALHQLPSTGTYADCAGLWGAAPNDLWAACTKGDLLHWDGTMWTKATSPTTADLQDIYGFAANDIWAVGNNNTLLHYNGTAWTKVTAPSSGALIGVWGSSASDVYAVGSQTLGGGRVIHFNGSAWSEVLTTTSGEFDRVSGSASGVWAAGYPALLYTFQ